MISTQRLILKTNPEKLVNKEDSTVQEIGLHQGSGYGVYTLKNIIQ